MRRHPDTTQKAKKMTKDTRDVEDGCCPFKIMFDEDLYVVFDEDLYVLFM